MKNKNVGFFLLVLLVLASAIFYYSKQKPTEVANTKIEKIEVQKEDNQFVIVPEERIGNLLRVNLNKSNLFDKLVQAFGTENIAKKDVYIGEGYIEPGFAIYPDTPNEVEVYPSQDENGDIIIFALPGFNDFYPQYYDDSNQTYKGAWRLSNGLKVGSTLDEVGKINGKFFNLYGFGWDYGGTVSSWLEGNLPEELIMIFVPTSSLPAQERNKILGDSILQSNDPLMQKSKPVIQKIYIRWQSN